MLKRNRILAILFSLMLVSGLSLWPAAAAPQTPEYWASAQSGGDVASHLEAALDAAHAEDWDTVEAELNEALDLSTDAQQHAAIEELLEDLDRGDYEEVISDLEGMVGGGAEMSPVESKLDATLDAAREEDWDRVEEELNEALDLSTDAQQHAAIEELLEDLDRGDYEEVITDLEGMLQQG